MKKALEKTIQYNNYPIDLKPFALGRKNDRKDFILNPSNFGNASFLLAYNRGLRSKDMYKINMEIKSLDSIVNSVKSLLIKIDAEGYDYDIALGAKKTIMSCDKSLLMAEYSSNFKKIIRDKELNAFIENNCCVGHISGLGAEIMRYPDNKLYRLHNEIFRNNGGMVIIMKNVQAGKAFDEARCFTTPP